MCGIAGFAGYNCNIDDARGRVRVMCDAIFHRGPNDAGYWVGDDVALGMRRLSIIDVEGGHQPISNEDGTVTVVFNGEIYNHRALRKQLEAAGHRFGTNSDTEVLVHLYEERGCDMVGDLHGMFAFALWDRRERQLLLARDRTGMKPLSYRIVGNEMVFFSELRSLFALGADGLRVSNAAVMGYLSLGYVPDPISIMEGVRKLEPAHALLWNRERGVRHWRYWTPPGPVVELTSPEDLVEQLRERLHAAVSSHLESEVPLGAFLSGGLDSSLVVALMRRCTSGPVKTFTIGFTDGRLDESSEARSIARELGTEHTELVVSPEIGSMFDSIASMFDEPFGDSSAMPTLLVSQLARQAVTVALSGDGGDELFGGYTRYRDVLAMSATAAGSVRKLVSGWALHMPHILPGRNRLVDLGRTRLERYLRTVSLPLLTQEGGVVGDRWEPEIRRAQDRLRGLIRNDLGSDVAAVMMLIDIESYLPGDILTKVDRASMAVSLEARVPLLDCDLVDFALRIPGKYRVVDGQTKYLFRKAIRGIVPDSVLSRPKRGFEVPLGRWLKGPLKERLHEFSGRASLLGDLLDTRAVRRLVFEHSIGRRDHSHQLWRLMVLFSWLDALREGRLARPPSVPAIPSGFAVRAGTPA